MRMISLRRLLCQLTVVALSASGMTANAEPSPSGQVDLDDDAPIDRGQVAAADAVAVLGRNLAKALPAMRPLERTYLATSWAASSDRLRRAAIASALTWRFPLFGDQIVIEHLSRDDDAKIRAVAARAAWVRRATLDSALLARLGADPDPAVRANAKGA